MTVMVDGQGNPRKDMKDWLERVDKSGNNPYEQAVDLLREKVKDVFGEKQYKMLEPWINTYGTVVVKMTAQQIYDFTNFLIKGNTEEAYKYLYRNFEEFRLVAESSVLVGEMEQLVKENAEKVALQKKAITMLLSAVLSMVVAMAGF